MALTVLRQPYDYSANRAPWWATMAEKVLVPMVTGALERQRQRDEYRKQNAIYAEVEKILNPQAASTTGGGVLPSMSGQSSNGWENAFNSMGDSPLTQFDTGTAGIAGLTPFSSMSGVNTQAAQPRTTTRADIIKAINQQRGLPRFSGVNPEFIDKMQKAMLDEYETQRLAEARNKAAEKFINAETPIAQRNSTIASVIAGDLPESFSNLANNIYTADRPQNSILNTGGQQRVIRVDPVTGETKEIASFENTLTPQQVQSGQLERDKFDYSKIKDERDYELKKQPKIHSIGRGDDGVMYMYFDDGSQRAVTPGTAGLSTLETQQITSLEARRKELITQHTNLTKELGYATTDAARSPIVQGINEINAQIKEIDGKISNIYQEKINPTPKRREATTVLGNGENIGLNMLGGNGTITSPFGVERKRADGSTKTHAGIDIAAENGTEILMPDLIQNTTTNTHFLVTKVANDVNGYGNYVDLRNSRGSLNGHTVELRIGHMKDGSINVRKGESISAGELIGQVGNTGNSRGKNGGYHMHLEIKIDGKHVDPATAWSIIQKFQQEEASQQGNAGNAQQGNNPPQGGNANTNNVNAANANAGAGQAQGNLAAIFNNPNLQQVNMPDAYTANNAPLPQVQQPQPQIAQVDAMTGTTPATQQAQQDTAANTPQSTFEQDVADVLNEANQSMPQYDLSDAELSAALSGSGVFPRGARLVTTSTPAAPVDPDGGLSQYRADGDNSPVTWRNTSGQPMRTNDGQLFTQRIYDEWKQKADAGGFKDVGVNNGADLDKWLNDIGMLPDRPSEENGINRLNGNPTTRADEAQDTTILPFNVNPSTSPEKFQAPAFTDEINESTPTATQELLDGLNGITDSRYRNWTQALQRFHPEMTNPQIAAPEWRSIYDPNAANNIIQPVTRPTYTPQSNEAAVQASAAPQAQPQQRAVPRQAAPAAKPRAGRTNYEQQRNAVDGAAKRHGVDSRLIRAIIQTESSWNPNARSKVGAMGLMQLMPKTAKTLGVKNAYDPAQNIEGGTKYIAQLIKQFGGDVSKALMAYNCGPGNVKRGRIPAASKTYAKNVMSIYRSLK